MTGAQRPPRLNRRLVLEAPVTAADGAGGFTGGWAALGTVWAEMRAGRGDTGDAAGMPVAAMAYRVVLRAQPPGSAARPHPGQRFRDGARVFAIRAVAEADPAGRFLICFVQEEVAA